MRNVIAPSGHDSAPVTVQTAHGRAEFERTDPAAANLVLEYEISELQAAIPDASDAGLQKAVEEACRQEVEQMRDTLRSLGDALAAQLSDEGYDPAVAQQSDDNDRRTWIDRRTEFVVDPSDCRSVTQLDGYRGSSDSRLVRKTVEVTIAHRELHIRDLYQRMLADVTALRKAKQQQAPAATPPPPSSSHA